MPTPPPAAHSSTTPPPSDSGTPLLERIERLLSWRGMLITWVLLFQWLMLIYGPSLATPFLYDDFPNIVTNEDLRADRPLAALLADHPSSTQFDRRPVGGLVSLFNFRTGGLNEKPFRLTNIIIHWLAAGALCLVAVQLAERIGKTPYPRLFAVLLAVFWAVHPIQSTAVIYISQRMESLMTLFFLVSCACLLNASRRETSGGWRAASAVAAFLCLLSKENGVGLPLLLLVLDRLFVAGSWKNIWLRHRMYYLALALGWTAASVWILQGPRVGEWNDVASLASPWRYFQTECNVVLNYLRLVFWPSPLVFAPVPRVAENWHDWFPHLVVLAGVFGWLSWRANRKPWVWVPLLAILLVLAPTSSFIPVPLEPAFDYRMHLPSAGVFALLLVAAWRLVGWVKVNAGWTLVLAGVTAMALSAGTRFRAETYARPETIWMDVVIKEPENINAWFNLSAVFLTLNKPDESRLAAEKAHEANQIFQLPWIEAKYHRMLGLLAEDQQKWSEAESHFSRAVKFQPDFVEVRVDLARILVRVNRPAEVLQILDAREVSSRLPVEGTIWRTIALARLGFSEEARTSAVLVENAKALSPILEVARQSMRQELSKKPAG